MNKTVRFLLLATVILAPCCSGHEDPVEIPQYYPDPEEEPVPSEVSDPFKVECKKNITTTAWTTYDAYTVDCIAGFKPSPDPATDQYGGWTSMNVGNADRWKSQRRCGT